MAAFLLVLSGWGLAADAESAAVAPFPEASVHFEQNATDGDVEVVFEVKGGDDGLAELLVVSPDGRRVVVFSAPASPTLGMRQFRFESPEPTDVEALKAVYPEGVYEFSGRTPSGAKLAGKSSLSHRLPLTATFAKPAETETVPVKDLEIAWKAVEGVVSYIVEIAQDELNVNITALLPGSSISFAVPDGFLRPGREYQVSIGTVNAEGNISFVETTVTTRSDLDARGTLPVATPAAKNLGRDFVGAQLVKQPLTSGLNVTLDRGTRPTYQPSLKAAAVAFTKQNLTGSQSCKTPGRATFSVRAPAQRKAEVWRNDLSRDRAKTS